MMDCVRLEMMSLVLELVRIWDWDMKLVISTSLELQTQNHEDDIDSQCDSSPGVRVVHQTTAHDWLVVGVSVLLQRLVHIGLAVHPVVTLLYIINISQSVSQ